MKKIMFLLIIVFILIPGRISYAATVIDTGTEEGTEEVTEEVFGTSGREYIDNEIGDGIMGEDWEFGDEVLPSVDGINIFERVYGKLWEATTGLQKIVCIFAIIFMLFSLVMILVSALGNRARLPWYLLSLLICALIFTCSLYAPEIMAGFNSWFMSGE